MAIPRVTPADDSGTATTGAIFDAAFLALFYDSIEDSWAWDNFTCEWGSAGGTPHDLGNGSIVGVNFVVGRLISWRVVLTFGSTTVSGSGNWTFSLPLTSSQWGEWGSCAMMRDDSAGLHYRGGVIPQSTSKVAINYAAANAAAGGVTPIYFASVDATTPFTWTTGDILDVRGRYELP